MISLYFKGCAPETVACHRPRVGRSFPSRHFLDEETRSHLGSGASAWFDDSTRQAKCWRFENHRHGDIDPSLGFFEKRNRCRCFVCDMRGGHSNVDLVMGVLDFDLGSAVRWIAERFTVPNIKVGRPSGSTLASPAPYRVGVNGSEWEVIVRSGMWGALRAAERSVLLTLDKWQDVDTGLTRLSYRAIMRYSGVAKTGNVSSAIKKLKNIHALQTIPGLRVGLVRECSAYRVTLDDPKFLEHCNSVCTSARAEIAQERAYRASQKAKRQRDARKPNGRSSQTVSQNTNTGGGLRPPAPPAVCFSDSNSKARETPTCEGLNLSFPGAARADLSLPARQREIGTLAVWQNRQAERDPAVAAFKKAHGL
jgi:hypothetical protein